MFIGSIFGNKLELSVSLRYHQNYRKLSEEADEVLSVWTNNVEIYFCKKQ